MCMTETENGSVCGPRSLTSGFSQLTKEGATVTRPIAQDNACVDREDFRDTCTCYPYIRQKSLQRRNVRVRNRTWYKYTECSIKRERR